MNRRRLLQQGALAALGAAASRKISAQAMAPMRSMGQHRQRTLDASKLESFVDAMPRAVLQQSAEKRSDAKLGAVHAPYYAVRMREQQWKFHRDLPASRIWSYGDTGAPVLWEARKDQGVLLHWHNELPAKHILPVDVPMQGMEDAPETRTVAHMHGARVPHVSDGYPTEWFGPGQSRLCFYPNHQDAAALWAHDHAMGVSRMNTIAGLTSWYIVRDAVEDALALPSGEHEVAMLLYDRSFTEAGQLYYPNPPDEGAWSEEYLGDAVVVNGKVRPFLDVEPRTYRFRIGNVANSRFFSLALSNEQSFHVIGSDQGLLAAPVETKRFVLGAAERTDLLIDFSTLRGSTVVLHSDTLEILQFRVRDAEPDTSFRMPKMLRAVERIVESQAVRTRPMTLNEFDGDKGEPMTMLLNRKHWSDPVTEIVKQGTTEIWSLANLTEDTHPIHLHMVRFQILDRQTFAVDDYLADESLRFTGERVLPEAQEMGWKDVVQCPPGTVTRIIVPFTPYAGKYLWHCHILEHEANDMMRPYVVEV